MAPLSSGGSRACLGSGGPADARAGGQGRGRASVGETCARTRRGACGQRGVAGRRAPPPAARGQDLVRSRGRRQVRLTPPNGCKAILGPALGPRARLGASAVPAHSAAPPLASRGRRSSLPSTRLVRPGGCTPVAAPGRGGARRGAGRSSPLAWGEQRGPRGADPEAGPSEASLAASPGPTRRPRAALHAPSLPEIGGARGVRRAANRVGPAPGAAAAGRGPRGADPEAGPREAPRRAAVGRMRAPRDFVQQQIRTLWAATGRAGTRQRPPARLPPY